MDLKPKFRADRFIYPAESSDIMRIQDSVQKKLKGKDLDKELESLGNIDKSNVFLTLYAYVSYDEGYRKGLKELGSKYTKFNTKNRSKNYIKYYPNKEDLLKITKLTQKRINSKRQRSSRTNQCIEHNIENTEESFALIMTIHTFFEAGYSDITLNTNNMFKEISNNDIDKATKMSNLFDELFSEIV